MLDVMFFIAYMCSINTCMVGEIGPTKIIAICAPADKPVAVNDVDYYRHYFVEPSTGRKLVLQIQTCSPT